MQERFEKFTMLIVKLARNIKRIKSLEMEEFELKSPHVSCLYYLNNNEGLTFKQLCEACDEDKASVSRSVEHLVGKGLLTHSSTNINAYKSKILLTEEGKRIADEINKKISDVLEDAGKGVSDDERAIMYRSLTIISDNLEKISESHDK